MSKFICFLLIVFAACHINRRKEESSSQIANEKRLALNDKHVHTMSPALIALWKGMGIPFSREDHFYANIDTILATTGANSMSLISMAYVYSSGEFGDGSADIMEKVKTENEYLAGAKSKYPNSVKAFYGVDPLHDSALGEIERCHKELKLDGIKLHHNASQVYLTEAEHLSKVKTIFRYASENSIPVLMHFDNGHPKFGKEDVELLADSVLSDLEYVSLQIAHFGTSGGFSQKTKTVLDGFIGLFEENHAIRKHKITFDISAVCLDKDAEGVSRLTEKEFEELAVYCRKLGFDRIVFGTDYPLYKAADYLDLLKQKLRLTDNEVDKLLEEK